MTAVDDDRRAQPLPDHRRRCSPARREARSRSRRPPCRPSSCARRSTASSPASAAGRADRPGRAALYRHVQQRIHTSISRRYFQRLIGEEPAMKVVVFGATGTIGQALVPVLARDHEVVAVSRSARPAEGSVRWVQADATDAASVRAALEGADVAYYLVHSLGSSDFERRDRAGGRDGRARGVVGGAAADHLPRRPRRRLARPLAAPAQPHRDGPRARLGQRAGDDAARGDGRRRRQRGVRDDPRARRPPARDDLPALGLDADAADRARRRRRLSRGGLRPRGPLRREPRRRRPRGHDLSRDDRADRAAARAPAADRRGAGADAAALVVLAPARHAGRREGRPPADRGPAHRDDRARRPHPRS